MKYTKFTLATTTEALDFLADVFEEAGIEGMEIEDNVPLTEADTKGMFIDILPELAPDIGDAKVSFYLDDTYDIPSTLKRLKDGLDELKMFVSNLGSLELTKTETEDKDWLNNWKQYFKPFMVDDILVKPTWEDTPSDFTGETIIQIDPGMAFGTGQHETTQLCLRSLKKYIKQEDCVLDVGCGSGILGICALMIGAKNVIGTDLDENAIVATKENREINNLPEESYQVICGNIIDDKQIQEAVGYEKYDIAVANILADVIALLQEEIVNHIKIGGYFISSGILYTKEEFIREKLESNPSFEIVETTYQGEWVSFVAKKVK